MPYICFTLQLEYEDMYTLVVLHQDKENSVIFLPNEQIPEQVCKWQIMKESQSVNITLLTMLNNLPCGGLYLSYNIFPWQSVLLYHRNVSSAYFLLVFAETVTW